MSNIFLKSLRKIEEKPSEITEAPDSEDSEDSEDQRVNIDLAEYENIITKPEKRKKLRTKKQMEQLSIARERALEKRRKQKKEREFQKMEEIYEKMKAEKQKQELHPIPLERQVAIPPEPEIIQNDYESEIRLNEKKFIIPNRYIVNSLDSTIDKIFDKYK